MNSQYTEQCLSKTLDLAKRGQGHCAPNPAVGAIVVKDGHIIGEGYHRGPGQAHAEIDAIQRARENVAGSILFVSLEPCCIYGRTPPCTQALIDHRFSQVIYAYQDPNPAVAGKGHALLEAAGIPCHQVSVSAISEFYQPYAKWTKTRRPWLSLKIALSQDGMIAGENGQTVAITEQQSNIWTHQQRQSSDAILSTVKTVIHDDPQFNVRLNDKIIKKPVIIIDQSLECPLDATIMRSASKVYLLYQDEFKEREKYYQAAHIECIPIQCGQANQMNLSAVIEAIGQLGFHHLWVEVGARMAKSLLEQELIDDFYLIQSKKILGDKATPWLWPIPEGDKKILSVDAADIRYKIMTYSARP